MKGSTGFVCKHDAPYENRCGLRPKNSTIDAIAKFTSHVMDDLYSN